MSDVIDGAAVRLDKELLRKWLAGPGDMGMTAADTIGIGESFGVDVDEVLSVLDETVEMLGYGTPYDWWTVRPDVEYVSLHRAYANGGLDGGLVTVDFRNGVRVAGLTLEKRNFVQRDTEGDEALVWALSIVAHEANTAAQKYRDAIEHLTGDA